MPARGVCRCDRPRHGGKDHGAVGRKAKEKDIVLAVGKAFGRKIKDAYGRNDEVKVVYTRDDDTFVTLQGRADIANKAKGDLFVSIHANSWTNGHVAGIRFMVLRCIRLASTGRHETWRWPNERMP